MRDSNAEPAAQTLEDREAFQVQALAGLEPVHYREAFAIAVDTDRRPVEWSRLIMEGASPGKRATMLRAWTLLGLKLAPANTDGQVLGWRILHNGADAVVLAAESIPGLSARIVLTADPQRVVQVMMVRYDRWFARPLWQFVAPKHRRFVKGLLADAIPRPGRTGQPDSGQRAGGRAAENQHPMIRAARQDPTDCPARRRPTAGSRPIPLGCRRRSSHYLCSVGPR